MAVGWVSIPEEQVRETWSNENLGAGILLSTNGFSWVLQAGKSSLPMQKAEKDPEIGPGMGRTGWEAHRELLRWGICLGDSGGLQPGLYLPCLPQLRPLQSPGRAAAFLAYRSSHTPCFIYPNPDAEWPGCRSGCLQGAFWDQGFREWVPVESFAH